MSTVPEAQAELLLSPEDIEAIEACIETAKRAGCPPDQVENLMSGQYFPYPWQWNFHAACREADSALGPVMIAAGGSRGPGKTTGIFGQVCFDDCQRFAGLKVLYLRKTGKTMKESFDDLVSKNLANRITYKYASSTLRFNNGSFVLLGGFANENDIEKYLGIEYDLIVVEEANLLSQDKIDKLRGSLRTTKEGWRPRMYLSFNPGGIGHGYVKTTFVEPYRTETQKNTRFFPATYQDNPILLESDPAYVSYLEGLEGQLGKAWREGDFDILAGQYFTSWNRAVHVCMPFDPFDDEHKDWRNVASLDYGHDHCSAIYWGKIAPNGQVFLHRELYRSGLTYTELADEFVARMVGDEWVDYMVADPSCWAKKGEDSKGLSGIELFQARVKELTNKSLRIEKANNDRLGGWAVVREFLRPYPVTEHDDVGTAVIRVTSKLQIMDGMCPELVRTIPLQIHDERNPEDLEKDNDDDGVDSLRYFLMSRPRPDLRLKSKESKETLAQFDAVKKRLTARRGSYHSGARYGMP